MRPPWEPQRIWERVVFDPGSTAMIVMMAVGTAMSAAGAMQSAQAQSSAAEFNAAQATNNAASARAQASQDAMLQSRTARQKIGAAEAAYGASGVTMEGSPLDVLESSAASAELDRQTILYKGELRAMGYANSSLLDTMQGNAATQQGYYKAGSSLLIGGANIASKMPMGDSGGGDPTYLMNASRGLSSVNGTVN